MRVSVSEREPAEIRADALVVLFRQSDRGERGHPLALIEHLRPHATRLIQRGAESVSWLETRELPTPRVLYYCLAGAPADWDPELEYLGGQVGSFGREDWALLRRRALRNAGAAIERACCSAGIRHAALVSWPSESEIELVVEGALIRAHDPRAWERSNDGPVSTTLRQLTVCPGASPTRRTVSTRVRETVQLVEAINFARELADLPGNIGTPMGIVERVRARSRERGGPIQISTISATEAATLGMGLFTAVDAGAPERGCILRLDYAGPGRGSEPDAPLLALLGKGLTHDTGGYNLKTDSRVHELTYDKAGAAAVIAAMFAIAALELPVRLVGLCPLTENCVDARAYKPGDVLTACDGTTVFIENTDAEGRLVLGDVLAWLRTHDPRPDLAIDLATLTGSVHAALGDPYAALYCNEDRARELLLDAGRVSGELVWPMPIHDAHDRDLGHHKADLRNIGAVAGGPSSAAAFLRSFVDYPWAHIDLAGKSHTEYARECYGPGATGFGTQLLIELVRRYAAQTE